MNRKSELIGGNKMYIEKYWGNYIGGTDDSLTLLDYLIGKQKKEVTLKEIFAIQVWIN